MCNEAPHQLSVTGAQILTAALGAAGIAIALHSRLKDHRRARDEHLCALLDERTALLDARLDEQEETLARLYEAAGDELAAYRAHG